MIAVPGMTYVAGFIDAVAESQLLAALDAKPWLKVLKPRVQHYGYRYDYRSHKVDPSMYLGELSEWVKPLTNRLTEDGCMEAPDQLSVN